MAQKSKNLVDVLSELDGDRIVKIGAKGGTSFFYCGDVETFLENIEEYSNDCYTIAKRMRDRAWIHLEPYLEKPSKATNQNYSMWLEELSKRARAAYITNLRFSEFKPLVNRDILESFVASKAADDERPLVFTIEGYERGKYWTIDDAKGKDKFAIGIGMEAV